MDQEHNLVAVDDDHHHYCGAHSDSSPMAIINSCPVVPSSRNSK